MALYTKTCIHQHPCISHTSTLVHFTSLVLCADTNHWHAQHQFMKPGFVHRHHTLTRTAPAQSRHSHSTSTALHTRRPATGPAGPSSSTPTSATKH